MFTNLLKTISAKGGSAFGGKEWFRDRPRIKRVVGVILILAGLAAFFTPLTPGSWLAIIGLELLGARILFFDPLRHSFSEASLSRGIGGYLQSPHKIFSCTDRIFC